MDYFLEFHWWYIFVGVILFFIVLGKGKGGIVVKRLSADLDVLDQRFKGCLSEAEYCVFKDGSPDHIEIEIENLALEVDEELDFQLNGKTLATVKVKRSKEAEFDHWGDEGIAFPVVEEGDELVIKYQNTEVLKGRFQLNQEPAPQQKPQGKSALIYRPGSQVNRREKIPGETNEANCTVSLRPADS